MSPLLFNIYMEAVIKEVKKGGGEDGSETSGERKGIEITWPLVCRYLGFVR